MSLEVLLPCRPAEVGFGGKQGIFAFSAIVGLGQIVQSEVLVAA